MNYFVALAALLYLGAAGKYAYDGQWKMAGAFVAYAIANFFFMTIKEGK